MKRARHWLLLLLTLTVAAAGYATAAESQETELLFVMSAGSGETKGDTVVLHGVHAIVYFADRPERKSGHVTTTKFVELWNKPEGFGEDHPNAVLSVFGINGAQNTVVEVISIEAAGDTVMLTVQVLEGELPSAEFGAASMFFDPIAGNRDHDVGT